MHSAVMQNKKYIEFAKENTVEVLALQRLDEAVKSRDPKAVAYKAKGANGEEVLYMLEWPGLTLEEILALNRSPAGRFNQTGKIPYTSIVDPHTLEEIEGFRGGQSAKTLMKAAEEARRKLVKDHGRGISRRDIEKIGTGEEKAREHTTEKEFSRALEALEKAAGNGELPEPLQKRLSAAREAVVAAATAELQALEELSQSEPVKAKRELGRLSYKLRGTGLEDKAKELIRQLSSEGN